MREASNVKERRDLEVERARWERNLRLSIEERLNRGTVRPYRPGIDDGPSTRIWTTMANYKAWCKSLPDWMGYGDSKEVRADENSQYKTPCKNTA